MRLDAQTFTVRLLPLASFERCCCPRASTARSFSGFTEDSAEAGIAHIYSFVFTTN